MKRAHKEDPIKKVQVYHHRDVFVGCYHCKIAISEPKLSTNKNILIFEFHNEFMREGEFQRAWVLSVKRGLFRLSEVEFYVSFLEALWGQWNWKEERIAKTKL